MIRVREYIRQRGCRLLGPNCPGVISPGKSKMGIMPNHLFQPGATGIVSRSGTLTYEVAYALTTRGIGQSTVVGIGGDPINGTSFTEILHMFQEDPGTKSVIVIGEIGGTAEQEAASYIQDHMDIPAYGFIAGLAAPEGKRMGHAGAIVTGGSGTSAADKIAMFQDFRYSGGESSGTACRSGSKCFLSFAVIRAFGNYCYWFPTVAQLLLNCSLTRGIRRLNPDTP